VLPKLALVPGTVQVIRPLFFFYSIGWMRAASVGSWSSCSITLVGHGEALVSGGGPSGGRATLPRLRRDNPDRYVFVNLAADS